ncbi:unnamed protein product [Schistosoma turkestanicum]|nr:unnamed protein product [Schistosoma turkestanicum]
MDCYYDKKSLNGSEEELCPLASSSRAFILATYPKPIKTSNTARSCDVPDPKTDELIKRFKELKKDPVKKDPVKVKVDVSALEHRFRQLKGLSDEKPTSFPDSSLPKVDQVSRLVEKYIDEARIDRELNGDFDFDDDPGDTENFPVCYMCEGIAEFSCRECKDNFCKRCFNKTHNKRLRLEHKIEIFK